MDNVSLRTETLKSNQVRYIMNGEVKVLNLRLYRESSESLSDLCTEINLSLSCARPVSTMRGVLLLSLALLVTGQVRGEVEADGKTEALTFVLNHADTSDGTGGEGSAYKVLSNVIINFILFSGGEDEVSEDSHEEHTEEARYTSQVDDVAHANYDCGCKKSALADTVFKFYYFTFFLYMIFKTYPVCFMLW